MKLLVFLLVLIFVFGFFWTNPSKAHAENYVCGQDLNGDGFIDADGETAQCISTTQGQLCPIAAVDCIATYSDATCPTGGSLNPDTDLCETAPTSICPTGYTYSSQSGLCVATPECSTGTYDPDQDQCYEGDNTCPLGDLYTCMDNSGINQCSPNSCVDLDTTSVNENSTDLTSYQNDGEIDSGTGECLGQILVFNGKPGECRTVGVETSFFNCCSNSSGSFLIFTKYCREEEWQTNAATEAGRAHYIGTYCVEEWPLIGCVQRANVYCVFKSKLSRIIHEQGRVQLNKFAPSGQWGSAESPNCVGFTPEEFQMLDFSKIDLSEYFGDIQTKAIEEIQQNMGDKVNEFYQNIK